MTGDVDVDTLVGIHANSSEAFLSSRAFTTTNSYNYMYTVSKYLDQNSQHSIQVDECQLSRHVSKLHQFISMVHSRTRVDTM